MEKNNSFGIDLLKFSFKEEGVQYTATRNHSLFLRPEPKGQFNIYRITNGKLEIFDLSIQKLYGECIYPHIVAITGFVSQFVDIDVESCKMACLNDYSCKAALIQYKSNLKIGNCSLGMELYSLRNNTGVVFNDNALAFIKVRLGRGGFGSVFEGVLHNSTKVVVKRLGPDAKQGKKEILLEVETIGNIHHFNLVRLVGYCAQRSNRLLVYQYMFNGSLDKWIFHRNHAQTLTWETRKKIIVQIAKGLEYLHDYCNPNIIHFDIKPQNILLDIDLNVKISDFGLARLIDKDHTHVMTMPKGTSGYMALKLIGGRNITVKIDIYSFGVVMLEIICGRKSSDSWHGDYLIDTLKIKAEENQPFDLIDEQSEDMQNSKEDVVRMIRIAISCLQKKLL
ncbi:G-type lectin S-receptor-like serine/threonine-protein kinase At5g24080 [Pistacia vera]|uniref:G-type lectin S-receptor-like serine/threonine-protein kinase At5g24080 n=1 Tax=Pistacia vera TaxID=55513 RepID=UPI0012632B3C|nr:G-type lectin S-receptor-like serine/threonine-protein kinase At5g24080 [Pistacia vera]